MNISSSGPKVVALVEEAIEKFGIVTFLDFARVPEGEAAEHFAISDREFVTAPDLHQIKRLLTRDGFRFGLMRSDLQLFIQKLLEMDRSDLPDKQIDMRNMGGAVFIPQAVAQVMSTLGTNGSIGNQRYFVAEWEGTDSPRGILGRNSDVILMELANLGELDNFQVYEVHPNTVEFTIGYVNQQVATHSPQPAGASA